MKTIVLIVMFAFFFLGMQAQEAIKTHESVQINGISQWIGVRGDDDSKPLLLFLHGGPGFSSRNYSKKFIKYLKKDFMIAQWDQRESGITSHWGPFSDSLTLELFHQDTEEVVNYLLKRFSKKKIYLVGFSWGGFLGMHFASKHPELLYAYVSVSSMIHQNESEQLTLNLLKEKAELSGDQKAKHEISTIRVPFSSPEELYFQRKWTLEYLNKNDSNVHYSKKLFEDWGLKWMPLFLKAAQVNLAETSPEILCPVYFFHSDKDYVSNHIVAKNYFSQLNAKDKEFIWFEKSTHEIPNQEPEKFSEELIKILNKANAF